MPTKNNRRKRNESSPGSTSKPSSKKHLLDIVNSDSESDYFDTIDNDSDSKTDLPCHPPHPPHPARLKQPKMADVDIELLCAKLAPVLAETIKETLKTSILNEVKTEIRKTFEIETKGLKDKIKSLESENQKLKCELKEQMLNHDELNQYGRRMCLDIVNCPGDMQNESPELLEKRLLDEAKRAGIPLTSADIDKCHRKGRYVDMGHRKVIIKFTNSKARDRVYWNRRKLADGVFVQENLTPYREFLSFRCRQLKRVGKVSKTWISGCRVFAQVTGEDKGRHIRHIDDILAISGDTE